MNHEESFKNWLPNNKVNGKSVGSYISYLKSVERQLACPDKLLETGLENALVRITAKSIPNRPENTLIKYRTAIKKYWKFLQDKE